MKRLFILLFSIVMAGEMTVDGNLTVADTLQVTTIKSSTIDSLLSLIAQLEIRIAQLECQNTGIIPDGYCDCFFHTLDECNECNGDNSSCSDECGIPNGDNSSCSDECGIPNGDNSSCSDCANIPNGESLEDMCGTCDNDSSNDCVQDCYGNWGGDAEADICGVCGGNAISEDECDFALNFNGVSDYVQLNQDAFSGSSVTLTAWFKPNYNMINTTDSGKPIYCQGAGTASYATFGIGLRPNEIWFEMSGAADQKVLLTNNFEYEVWNHLAVTYDGVIVKTYINGELESIEDAPNSSIIGNDNGAFIGRRWDFEGSNHAIYSFEGKLDMITAWSLVLSIDQIQSLMTANPLGNEEGLKGCWNFDENTGEIANDCSGNQNHGAIFGADWDTKD